MHKSGMHDMKVRTAALAQRPHTSVRAEYRNNTVTYLHTEFLVDPPGNCE